MKTRVADKEFLTVKVLSESTFRCHNSKEEEECMSPILKSPIIPRVSEVFCDGRTRLQKCARVPRCSQGLDARNSRDKEISHFSGF